MPRSFLASPEGLKQLRAAKARRRLSFAAIAKRAGVSAEMVSRLFHPERKKQVSQARVAAIARVLDLPPETIVPVEAWPDPIAEAERRIEDALQKGRSRLDLSGLDLTTVPAGLGRYRYLTQLDLSQNQLTAVPEELGQLSNLMLLDLSQNRLTAVPDGLEQFSNLAILYLCQNQIEAVSPAIGQLSSLMLLDLSRNRLATVPGELGQLSQLSELRISKNQLTAVPEALFEAENISLLSLNTNRLTALPGAIARLSKLKMLSLYNNHLTALPNHLGTVTSLQELYIQNNQIAALPESLGQLSQLTYLFLNGNPLGQVPPLVWRLTALEHLSLARLGLRDLPEAIVALTQLKELFLNGNRLESLPESLGQLGELEQLYLDGNCLKQLPRALENLTQLRELYLHDNEDLPIHPEVLGPTCDEVASGETPANPQKIINFYLRSQASPRPLNEAKMILVGFGCVGKTSLVNRLVHSTFDPDSRKTEGVNVTQWQLPLPSSEPVKLHVWDFGGQEIMHATHQFFLTQRSVYLLVLNGRQGHEDTDAEYWLELIRSFGGDSPVIVVLNKIGEQPFDVNRGALRQKFGNIREFVATDCQTGQGIDQLQRAIERATDALEHLRDPFPTSWVAIKNQLADMADNYISFEQYRDLCRAHGETDLGAQDALAVHLHNLGIALNYKDAPRLRDTHVLNPRWVTHGIYTLLNAPALAEARGELEAASLLHTLDSAAYPPERHGFLLELMQKFELCFRFEEDENRYLIPDLLDKQQPAAATSFDPAQCLNFRYRYPVLPEGLLPRFIARTHILSDQQRRWRSGVILHFEGNRALVRADGGDRCVSISVDGPVASRRRLLAVIRSDFERIHRSFRFRPKELVPVPGQPSVNVDYRELLTREDHRQTSFDVFTGEGDAFTGEGLVTLSVRDLLNGVDLEGSRRTSTTVAHQPLRLFYSYSHRDEVLRDELETHLKILQREGLIQPWHDRRILPGDDWADDIDDNLTQADIILLLLSADFISSRYCYEVELPQALQRHRAGAAVVVPIILRPVDWQTSDLMRLNVLPANGQAVTQWGDRDAAWLSVETGIKRVVEIIRSQRLLHPVG